MQRRPLHVFRGCVARSTEQPNMSALDGGRLQGIQPKVRIGSTGHVLCGSSLCNLQRCGVLTLGLGDDVRIVRRTAVRVNNVD